MGYSVYYKTVDAVLISNLEKAQSELRGFKDMLNVILEKSVPKADTLNGYNSKLNELQQVYDKAADDLRKFVPEELYFQAGVRGVKYSWYTAGIYGYLCIEISMPDKVSAETQAWVEKLMKDNGYNNSESKKAVKTES